MDETTFDANAMASRWVSLRFKGQTINARRDTIAAAPLLCALVRVHEASGRQGPVDCECESKRASLDAFIAFLEALEPSHGAADAAKERHASLSAEVVDLARCFQAHEVINRLSQTPVVTQEPVNAKVEAPNEAKLNQKQAGEYKRICGIDACLFDVECHATKDTLPRDDRVCAIDCSVSLANNRTPTQHCWPSLCRGTDEISLELECTAPCF